MTRENTPPPPPEQGDPDAPAQTERPPVARRQSTGPRALLIFSITATALCLGWWVGREVEGDRVATTMSRLSTRNSFLSEQNQRSLEEANRARQAAAEAAGEIAISRARLETLQRRTAELEQQTARQQEATRDVHASQEERWRKTQRELEETREQFKRYREAHREFLREEARGEPLGDLSYRDFTFRNAVIEEVTPAGIDIRHDAGAARLLFPLLPPDMRKRFAYEPGEAAEHLAAERERWIKARVVADNVRLAEASEQQERERRIAMRQAEKEVAKILEKLAYAKKSLAFCESKLGQPGKIAPQGYEWKIRQLKRDITACENQLEDYGIFR